MTALLGYLKLEFIVSFLSNTYHRPRKVLNTAPSEIECETGFAVTVVTVTEYFSEWATVLLES